MVDLGIPAIVQDQPLTGVEEADALRDVAQRRLKPACLAFELLDGGAELTLQCFVGCDNQLRESGGRRLIGRRLGDVFVLFRGQNDAPWRRSTGNSRVLPNGWTVLAGG
jgi:hypothetical protein